MRLSRARGGSPGTTENLFLDSVRASRTFCRNARAVSEQAGGRASFFVIFFSKGAFMNIALVAHDNCKKDLVRWARELLTN